MGKFAYVLNAELFNQVEFRDAEELLNEYNDFYNYNIIQYMDIYGEHDDVFGAVEDIDKEKEQEVREHNARASAEHFAKLFGNRDFHESCRVGFRVCWYSLQKILQEEYKSKVSAQQSAMNHIAPRLRNLASVMLFAEKLNDVLHKFNAEPEVVSTIKAGFELLKERVREEELSLPEFHKGKVAIAKFKKKEQVIEFCEGLFFTK
jgi:hypothetical protein